MIGTTPTHTFKLPISTENIKTVHVIYRQGDVNILTKTTEDCTIEGNSITVDLTQEETFLFNHNLNVEIQLRVLTVDDKALKSQIITKSATECLENEVLT